MPAKVLTDFPGPWQMNTRTVIHMYFSRDGGQGGEQLSQKQRIYMVLEKWHGLHDYGFFNTNSTFYCL